MASNVDILDTHIGRVKVIFQLPAALQIIGSYKSVAPSSWPKIPLAYIEWYTVPTLSQHDKNTHNMPSVKKSPLQADGCPPWSIIPLTNIRQSCMLIPNFLKESSSSASDTTLDTTTTFFVNNWLLVYTYKTIYKE